MAARFHHRSSLILHFISINIIITTTASPWDILPPLWLWLQAALKKKLKNTKKKNPTVSYVH
jgi:hypothetical protein